MSSSDAFDVSARVASTTKDSIYVKWHVENALHPPSRDLLLRIQGFQVRYQAVGSTVVQYSHRLEASASAYDITQLHENTYYDICVKVFVKLNSTIPSGGGAGGGSVGPASAQDVCVKGTTATDSLAVALGSTFGAFLALGFIVFLVFLAKWQHTRRMRKQKLVTSGYDENGVEQLRGCDDPKETFVGSGTRFHDDLAMSELSGQSSEVSIALYADQMQDNVDGNARGGGGGEGGGVGGGGDGGRGGEEGGGLGGDGGGSFHSSSGPSSGLPRNQQEASELVHHWIAGTSNSAPDCEEGGNWLLRPPPIPGVILRPQTGTADAETEEKKRQRANTPSSSAGLPASSSESQSHTRLTEHGAPREKQRPPARGNGEGEEHRPTNDEHSGAQQQQQQQHLFAHRALKPTSSNLW